MASHPSLHFAVSAALSLSLLLPLNVCLYLSLSLCFYLSLSLSVSLHAISTVRSLTILGCLYVSPVSLIMCFAEETLHSDACAVNYLACFYQYF